MGDFLTARWVNLILVTYRVPAGLLEKRLPPGCSLDRRAGDPRDAGYVSLVAFDFLDTRVLRIGWPGYRCFPEINLRYYVRHGNGRGVSFVREFVPRRVVAGMARWIYNEPYRAAGMSSETQSEDGALRIRHRLTWASREHTVTVAARNEPWRPERDSVEHFFKEHNWGFGTARNGELIRYEVVHPVWDVYPVTLLKLDWDWASVYGEEWGILQNAEPFNVVLAKGSEVRVSPMAEPR
jgi:uncharacterized protein YqjF (DUF2071 family)